jgi:hypothetical protein
LKKQQIVHRHLSNRMTIKIIVNKVNYKLLTSYNTNNYPTFAIGELEDENNAKDYTTEVSKTNLHKYIGLLQQFVQIQLDDKLMEFLKKYNKHCSPFGYLFNYDDECSLENFHMFAEKIYNQHPHIFNGTSWFFRMTTASPKDGTPQYPVEYANEVLEKIITSKRASYWFENGHSTLYFAPYEFTWDSYNEFRVFVYEKKITAISQYVCEAFTEYASLSDEQLETIVYAIDEFYKHLSIDLDTESFTMDIYVDYDFVDKKVVGVRLIEFNSFGYWLASGSCLFDWIRDHATLCGNGDTIVFQIGDF